MMIILLLILLPLVLSCPSPPTTTTTTTKRPNFITVPDRRFSVLVARYLGFSIYPDCPKFLTDCRIIKLNYTSMGYLTHDVNYDYRFQVSSKRLMIININKTHELEGNFLSYFSVSIFCSNQDSWYSVLLLHITGHYTVQCVWRRNMHVFRKAHCNEMHIFMARFNTQIP